MSNDDTHRVQFVADAGFIEQADSVATILDISRTDLIKRAIHDYLEARRTDDQFRRRAQEAFIDGRIDDETFRQALGTEELVRAKQLAATFRTVGEGVPDPDDAPAIPTDEEFYGDADDRPMIDLGDSKAIVIDSGDSPEAEGDGDEDAGAESNVHPHE